MNELVKEAQAFQDELVAARRYLHQNPELGMELPNTSAFVKKKLEEMGYEASYIGGNGVTALAGGKKPGKVILLRADMDALPIEELTDMPFKSTNGRMHACGHDFHTTMLLGAAKLLKAHEDEIEGTVKLMFQPGEETLQGAKALVEAGILENPKVDAAMMFHVASGMKVPAGLIIIPPGGIFSSASDWFEITINGKGGHGAMPETTIDPLTIAAHIQLALQAIRSREVASADNVVITTGLIQGGTTSNVIPDSAKMAGTIRTFDKKVREFVLKRVIEVAEGIAATFRATADAKILIGCPSVIVDDCVSNDIRESLVEALGAHSVPDVAALGMTKMNGSEDFSFVTEEVPSVMMVITAGSSDDGHTYPLHHPKVTFDESILSKGAAAYALTALGWLSKNK